MKVEDFRSICRCCLRDCKNIISFNIHGTLIYSSVVSDVLLKYTSNPVSKQTYSTVFLLDRFTVSFRYVTARQVHSFQYTWLVQVCSVQIKNYSTAKKLP